MPITKTQIIETIQAMPQTEFASIDEVLEEIVLLEKIEQGLKDIEDGNVYTEEEMRKIIAEW